MAGRREGLAVVVLATVAFAFGARGGAADDAADPLLRTPESWQVLVPRWKTLRARPGLTFYARKAGRTTDPYPYALAASDEMRANGRAFAVRPEAFGRFVTSESLGDPAGAAEAVRFFVHGREVLDAAAANRVLAEARRLAPTLAWSKIDVRHAGDAATPFAEPRSAVDGDARVVRRVFLQTDVEVRLVSVAARVDAAKGRVSIDETVLVAGPATERLSCGTGEDLADLERRRKAYVDEVGTIRRALLTALDPRRTRDAVRRVAKAGVTMAAIRAALGEPDDDVGSGIHRWVFALEEGAAVVGEAGPVRYVDLVSPVPGSPFPGPETTEAVYSASQTVPPPR